MSKDSGEQEKWKYKYLETLEDLEQKEHAWHLADESMRRGLSRLALLSTGLDAGLDVQLTKLRRALQDQAKSAYLDEIIAKISDYLKKMDEKSGDADSVAPSASGLDLLMGLAESIEFPRSCQPQLKKFRKALKGKDAEDQLAQLTNQFTALVVSAFYQEGTGTTAAAVAADSKSSDGWLKRIFSGDKGAQPESTDEKASTEIDNVAEKRHEYSPATSTAVDNKATQVDERVLETTLLGFLERLSFPTQFSDRVTALRDRLVAGLEADGVPAIVKAMVALVTDTRQQIEQEKEELELFLQQLGERLQEIDAMVDGAESNRLASLVSGRKLDEMVKAQVNDIEQTVQDGTDVVQMKGAIQGSIENIRQHLAEQRQQEEQRQDELEQQLKSVNQRLAQMEGESDRLRARLAEERVQAMTDPLTNVPNRLGYDKQIAQEFSRWQRYNSPLSILVCDIDLFKRINDTYGHKAGDRALVAIAKSMDLHIRETDYLARVGGEEFVVLLPETNLQQAEIVAEKLRKGVEACAFVYEGKPVPITISGGIAEFAAGDKIDDVYIRADRALYKAKEQGRNRFLPQK